MYGDRGRDLPEGADSTALAEHALEAVKEKMREQGLEVPDGLWLTIHDDRDRALRGGQSDLGSHAAAIAQALVMAAHDMMRVAGNSRHNSPNGFDTVMRKAIRDCRESMHKADDSLLRAEAELDEWVKRGGWDEVMLRHRIERARLARERTGAGSP